MSEVLFASQEWIDRVWGALRSSESLRESGATWCHGPIGLYVHADPDKGFAADTLIRFDLHEGEARDARMVDTSDVALIPTVFSGSVSRWTSLLSQDGTGSLLDGVRRAHMSFRGDLPAATRHAAMFDAFVTAARTVAASFESAPIAVPEAEHAGSAS